MQTGKQYVFFFKQMFLLVASFFFLIFHGSARQSKTDSLLTLLQNDKEDTVKVIHSSRLCWVYWGSGRYDSAMLHGNAAIQLALKLNFQKGLAEAYNNTGLVHYSRGNYPQALDYFFNALKVHEQLLSQALKNSSPDQVKKYKNETARNFGNIGLVYKSQEDNAKAQEYYLKALNLFEETGNKSKICAALGNMGSIFRDQEDYPKALDYYFRALKIAEELQDENGIGRLRGNIGSIYFEKEEYANALTYFSDALRIAKQIGDKNRIPIWLGNIGILYSQQRKYPDAEKYLLESHKLYQDIDDRYGLMDVNKNLSKLYERTGKYAKALSYYKIAMDLTDSLFSEEKNKEITRKEMNYEFEKKEAAAKAETDKQAAIAQAEKERQRMVLILVSCVLLLVLVFAAFIFRALSITRKQKQLIEDQKKMVDEKQKEILDSIHYARRIQTALLPPEVYIERSLGRLMKK